MTTADNQAPSTRPEPSRAYRWTVLLFVGLTMGCNYYLYDSINPMQRIFIEKLGFTATTFGWLNSAYAVSAILTLLIGGLVIDRIGTKRAITVFALICLLGAVLTAARGRPGMMIAGRAVLGLGGESLVVAATTVIAKWFKGKEISFAFGIKITIARLASVAADNSPTWGSRLFIQTDRVESQVGAALCCSRSARDVLRLSVQESITGWRAARSSLQQSASRY